MFKIGDRGRVIKFYCGAKRGDEGIIRGLPGHNGSASGYHADDYAIEFPSWSNGHRCNGIVPSGHGLWVPPDCLERIKPKPEKIVITHDGHTTLARLYDGKKLVKSAEAKCDPRDEFAFKEGAKIAFERLTEEEPPKFDKAMLTNGRFGYKTQSGWFVVVGNDIVYKSGGVDDLRCVNSNGEFPSGCKVECVVEARSFDQAEHCLNVIWKAPDFDPKKVKDNA